MYPSRLVLAILFLPLLGASEFPEPKQLPAHQGLPPLLSSPDATPGDWHDSRSHLKAQLAYYQYGRMPPKPDSFSIEDFEEYEVQNGQALQQTFRLVLTRNGKTARIRAGVIRPNRPGPHPVIIKNDAWVFDIDAVADDRKRQQYKDGGRDKILEYVSREAVRRGYALAKFNREDVAVDRPHSHSTGVFPLYPEAEYDWATIAAWAWFYQPLIDHLITQDWADPTKLIATGHSRGGKTALCASIYDERITIAAPSASGSGGTGSWRIFTPNGRHQDIEDMVANHGYWFTERLGEFIGHDNRLPVGSHTAKALIAPRGLINTLGADDPLSNPVGTRATFDAAQEVFQLLGVPDNQVTHWRPGGHGQLPEDWRALLDFADRLFFGKPSTREFNNWPATSVAR